MSPQPRPAGPATPVVLSGVPAPTAPVRPHILVSFRGCGAAGGRCAAAEMAASGNHIWRPASKTDAAKTEIVAPMNTTGARLLRHVVTTALLAASAMVVAWQVLFTGPAMGVNRYAPGQVSNTGIGGPAMQTGHSPAARVVGIRQGPLPSGVAHAQ
jgi:hypothetical protein